MAQLDWCISMIAKDNDSIKIVRNGQEELAPGLQKTLASVAVYNTKRGKAKNDYLEQLIPSELRSALKSRIRHPGKQGKLYQAG